MSEISWEFVVGAIVGAYLLFVISRELVRQFGPRTAAKEAMGFLFKGVLFFVGFAYMVVSAYIAKKLTDSAWTTFPLMFILWVLPTAIYTFVVVKIITPKRQRLGQERQEPK